ncbi:hypothetical protein ACJX0J_039108, partial [Zea mays]
IRVSLLHKFSDKTQKMGKHMIYMEIEHCDTENLGCGWLSNNNIKKIQEIPIVKQMAVAYYFLQRGILDLEMHAKFQTVHALLVRHICMFIDD